MRREYNNKVVFETRWYPDSNVSWTVTCKGCGREEFFKDVPFKGSIDEDCNGYAENGAVCALMDRMFESGFSKHRSVVYCSTCGISDFDCRPSDWNLGQKDENS